MVLSHPTEERKLTKKEADVLRLLCLHADQVLPRELVLNMVWGDDTYFLGRSLDVFISRLRKYLKLDPKVQIVMHMDGFGAPWLKRDSYYSYIKKEPVQFAGWKQFTKSRNDNPSTSRESILRLWPTPIYIQLQ